MATPFVIKSIETILTDHHVYFYEFIDGEMTEMLFLINTIDPGSDCLHLHMNNCGGSIHAGTQVLFALEEAMKSGVRVVLYIESICESMAAVFVCKVINMGAEVHMGDGQYLMFHNVSIEGSTGPCTNVFKDAQATKELYEHILVSWCKPILTDEEITNILNGVELYMPPGVLLERIKAIIPEGETVH